MTYKEYTLAVIKPDGVKYKVENLFEELVDKYELTIHSRKSYFLTRVEIALAFAKTSREYIDYMTSGPVITYLLSGSNSSEVLYYLKQEIRKQYQCEHRGILKNLLHSCDVGNEYALQSGLFFPELDLRFCTGIADLNVSLTNLSINNRKAELYRMKKQSNLCWVACKMHPEEVPFLWPQISNISGYKFTVIPTLEYKFKWLDKTYSILAYFPRGEIPDTLLCVRSQDPFQLLDFVHNAGGITALGFTLWDDKVACMIRELAFAGLKGIMAFDLARNLQELDKLVHFVDDELQHMALIGGSSDGMVGQITIGYTGLLKFFGKTILTHYNSEL